VDQVLVSPIPRQCQLPVDQALVILGQRQCLAAERYWLIVTLMDNTLHVSPLHVNPLHVNPLHVNPLHVNPLHVNPLHVSPFHVNRARMSAIDEEFGCSSRSHDDLIRSVLERDSECDAERYDDPMMRGAPASFRRFVREASKLDRDCPYC